MSHSSFMLLYIKKKRRADVINVFDTSTEKGMKGSD